MVLDTASMANAGRAKAHGAAGPVAASSTGRLRHNVMPGARLANVPETIAGKVTDRCAGPAGTRNGLPDSGTAAHSRGIDVPPLLTHHARPRLAWLIDAGDIFPPS
jgi:hypothetical protein